MFADTGIQINVGDFVCRCQGTTNPKGGDARAQAYHKVKEEKEEMVMTGTKGVGQGNFLLSHMLDSKLKSKEEGE